MINTTNMGGIFWVSIAWIIFYAAHSTLVLNSVRKMGERICRSKTSYRLFYSIFSTLSLLAVICLILDSTAVYLLEKSFFMTILSMVLTICGVTLLKQSFQNFSIRSFLGLSEMNDGPLSINGPHAYVRHPIYSALLLIYLGAFFFYPTDLLLASLIVLVIYLPIGIYLEEQKLIQAFGETYKEYQNKVKAVIPWIL